MKPNVLLLISLCANGNIFLISTVWLVGIVILSVPESSKGRRYFLVKFLLFLYPQ